MKIKPERGIAGEGSSENVDRVERVSHDRCIRERIADSSAIASPAGAFNSIQLLPQRSFNRGAAVGFMPLSDHPIEAGKYLGVDDNHQLSSQHGTSWHW